MAGEQQTGTRDVTFNLISVMYHALQAAETIGKYAEDARRAGDDALVECFEKAIEENREIADRCKHLLSERLSRSERAAGREERSQAPSPH